MITAFLGAIIGFIIGIPGIGYLVSPALKSSNSAGGKVSLGSMNNFTIGEPSLFTFTRTKVSGWEKFSQSYGVFVLRQSESVVRVFSNVCPHLSCRIAWYSENKEYICPCHDAHFDLQGEVISGPAPRPLDTFASEIDSSGNLLIQVE